MPVAQVIRCMPGRVNGPDRELIRFQQIAIPELSIRGKGFVLHRPIGCRDAQ